MKPNSALKDQMADSLYDTFNSGLLKIFGESLIVSINLPSPAFNPAKAGAKTVNGLWQSEATASGTASRCKFESFDKSKILEGSVTIVGGGGDLELQSVNIETGQMVTVTDGKGVIS